jgi:dUTP pyrophosphatase
VTNICYLTLDKTPIRYSVDDPTVNNPVKYATPNASGFDIQSSEDIMIMPNTIKAVSTGLHLQLQGTPLECQIRPRSGLALKHGITVLNSPGTIDNDYIGEIKIILINHGKYPFNIHKGDRIAQGVFAIVHRLYHPIQEDNVFVTYDFERVDTLEGTDRGPNGFGSTGVNPL